jgi:hypothetical protein
MKIKVLTVSVLCFLAFLTSSATAATETRFTRSLTQAQIEQVGLEKLNSDQLAVLDALIRRDTDTRASGHGSKLLSLRFSQRLSPDEMLNSGLAALPDAQRVSLDAMIEQYARPALAVSSGTSAPGTVLVSKNLERPLEIHGSFSLMYGQGSGGYSEYGGAMTLTYEDPLRGFAIGVGYSELHSSGGNGYRFYRNGYRRDHDPFLLNSHDYGASLTLFSPESRPGTTALTRD